MKRHLNSNIFSESELSQLKVIILAISHAFNQSKGSINLNQILRQNPKNGRDYFGKTELLAAFERFAPELNLSHQSSRFYALLTRKPQRSLSGVTPLTVLTKPYPCPGNCIFCPSDIKMPKSYLSSEPGAQRAAQNDFDPYLQVYNRLLAYTSMGHPTDKIELLVLGGTWSVYPESYRLWFIYRLFQALNDFSEHRDRRSTLTSSPKEATQLTENYNTDVAKVYLLHSSDETASWDDLAKVQKENESSSCRCVGLVLETRPDYLTLKEAKTLRSLGATKIQLGVQSLNDQVLSLNRRGHQVAESRMAVNLLRQFGFKLHLHWMPNLYGSDPERDKKDYLKLFQDPDFMPDELKIYPCSLIPKTPLAKIYEQGLWHPYNRDELLDLLSFCFTHTPRYCRLSRVIRDIPSQEIVVGNKMTNFRQLVDQKIKQSGLKVEEIRSRELNRQQFNLEDLALNLVSYHTSVSDEVFMEYIDSQDKISGFLRLSFPLITPPLKELTQSAIIRELHVYGQSTPLGVAGKSAQHRGLGKKLIEAAIEQSHLKKYQKLSVISAVGTRDYYRRLGFIDGELYQHYELN